MGVVSTLDRNITTKNPWAVFTQAMALEAIYQRCHVYPSHFPGTKNEWADGLSIGKQETISMFELSRRVRMNPADLIAKALD